MISRDETLKLPMGSVDGYIDAILQLRILTVEEERNYALRLRKSGDLNSARILIVSHLRFVVHVARGYSGYGLPQQDLIQEGTIGLMKAVRRYNPDKGVRLISFAIHWIRAEIHEFILRNWRIVKVATTKAQRKLFFNLRSAKKRLGWLNQQEIQQVAQDLGVKPETVLEMETRLFTHDLPWDVPITLGDDDNKENGDYTPANWLPDNKNEPATLIEKQDTEAVRHKQLISAIDKLETRSRDIIRSRWLSDNKSTLQELANKYGVSAERIRQLEKNAMKKVYKQIMLLKN